MIIPVNDAFRGKVNKHIKDEWGGPIIVTKGVVHDVANYDGFIEVSDENLNGYVLYLIDGLRCEIIVLQSLFENRGIGSALINAVIKEAKEHGCSDVWLITTNDNIHAIRYYQRFGFELVAVHINALDISRKLKPQIPLIGDENTPLKHEFEFSFPI